jgi:hypothetical protein
MFKLALRLSAAMALAIIATSPSTAAKLKLPPPKAPQGKIYSPGMIARDLEKRGYRIEKMKRKGTTYSVTATGPNRNRVQITVDGRSGDIVGLAVLKPADNLIGAIAAIVRAATGTRYVDDWHPFGIIVPDIYQTRWTVVSTEVWTDYSVEYVTEDWSGAGYRFAVPYDTIRPGYDGYSVTTLEVSEMGEPVYDVYEANGTEISTDYSEESVEISEATTFETTYESENAAMEESYLGGEVADEDSSVAEIGDIDVSAADEGGDEMSATDDAGDDDVTEADDSGSEDLSDGDTTGDTADEAADDPDDFADEPDEAADAVDDSAGEPDDDSGYTDEPDDSGDADEPDDSGDDYADDAGDDGGDDYSDDGGDPELQ